MEKHLFSTQNKTMTSHEFAQQLLLGPDLPIYTHQVETYAEVDDSTPLWPPKVFEGHAIIDGNHSKSNPVLIVSYSNTDKEWAQNG